MVSAILAARTLAALTLVALPLSVSASQFKLYAYGHGLEGDPVVYKDGLAYVYKGNSTKATGYTSIKFTSSSDTEVTSWTADPDNSTTSASNATWSDQLMFIPSTAGSPVGFSASPTSEQKTNVFRFFDNTVIVRTGQTFVAPFFVSPVSGDSDGSNGDDASEGTIYKLTWNDTTGVPVTLLRKAKN